MEKKGRFPGWPVESSGSEPSGPDSSDSTRKKGRKGPDSSRPEVLPRPKAETPERPEAKKVGRALTDIMLEGSSGERTQPTHEYAKKKAEGPEAIAEKGPEPKELGHVAAPPEVAAAALRDKPEKTDDDDEEEEEDGESHAEEHIDLPEHEHPHDDGVWPDQLVSLELEPGQLNGGEVILWRHDDEPHAKEAILPQPVAENTAEEPEPELVSAAEMAHPYQPEQQRARDYEATPAEAYVPVAGSGEGEPPVDGPGTEALIEESEPPAGPEAPMVPLAANRTLDPAEAYRQYMQREAVERAAADSAYAEPMVTKREAEDEAYYAARHAQNSGFLTGLLVAGLWARHRGKKLRRQFNQQFKKQDKQLQQTREDQRFYAAEQSKRQDESNRRLVAVQNQLTNTEGRLQQQELSGKQTEHALQRQENASRETAQALQQQESGNGERIEIPPDHRLETSAWHTIEVDARTGKPVERPAFAYGREYYRERAHESAPMDKRSAVAGEAAIAGAAAADPRGGSTGGGATGPSGATLPPPNVPSASTQSAPRGRAQAKLQAARDSLAKPTAAGPIWPYVIALVVIFICLVFLI